jgi:TonB family protein
MPKKVLSKLLLSVFLSAFLLAATAFAQTSPCPMRLAVVQNESETKVAGAAATAVNSQTKRIYKSVLRGGMPYFAKLPEGEYRITVSKLGYKRSTGDFIQDCSETDSPVFLIALYKGSSRQTVNINGQFAEGEMNVPPTVRAEPVLPGNYRTMPEATDKDVPPPQQYKGVPVEGGVLNGKAANLVKPPYPAAARAVRASGAVNVQVTIDEQGNVIRASAISGHPLLRAAAVQAARASTFLPTLLEGKPVKVTGIIVYNFVP